MANRRKAFLNQFGEAIFVRSQRSLMSRPVEVAERRGEALGRILYKLDRKHRDRTEWNLRLAFPDWPQSRIESTAYEVFCHFGRVAGDFLRSPKRSPEEVLASIEVHGTENFDAALAKGRGVLAITGHFGNWERMAHFFVATGRKMCVVARDANQEGVQQKVMDIRTSVGLDVLSRGSSAREILSRLRKNEVIAMLPDQNASDAFVPFFGHLCGTVLGPAVLHERTGAPILPIFCWRTGPGRYEALVKPALEFPNQSATREDMMAAIMAELESVIKEHPEQYLWMHDRWKEARKRGLMTVPPALLP